MSVRLVTMPMLGASLVSPRPSGETVTLPVVDLHLVDPPKPRHLGGGSTRHHVRAAFDREAMVLYANASADIAAVRDVLERLSAEPEAWERWVR